MKKFIYSVLIIFILSFNSNAYAQEMSENGWTASVDMLNVTVDSTCTPAMVDLMVAMSGIERLGENRTVQCTTAVEPFINFISSPPPQDMALLQTQTSVCLSCCAALLSINTEANMTCRSYCDCGCALRAFPNAMSRPEALVTLIGNWCRGPQPAMGVVDVSIDNTTEIQTSIDGVDSTGDVNELFNASLEPSQIIEITTPKENDVTTPIEITLPENLAPQDELKNIPLAPIPLSE